MSVLSKDIMSLYIRDGSFSITAVRRHSRNSTILDARDYPLKAPGSSEKARRDGLISGLTDFFEQNGRSWDDIIVVLSRKSVLFSKVWFPSTVKESLSTAIEFELENICPFKKEEAVYDYKVAEESGDGSRICVLLSLIKRSYYEELIDILREFSLSPTAVIASPVVWEGVDWLFGDDVTLDKVLIMREGEDLLVNTYSTKGLRDSVLYEGSAHLSERFEGLIGEESDSLLVFLWGDGLDELERDLNGGAVHTYKILPSQFHKRFVHDDTEIYTDSFIPALCASEIVKYAPRALNMIPIKDRPRQGRFMSYAFWALAGIVGLSLLVLSITPLFKQSAAIAELEKELSSISVDVDEILKQKEEIEASVSRLNEIREIRDRNPLDVLKELTLLMPDHTWLTYFRQNKEKIEVGGISESATSLISILELSPLFRDVSFSSPVLKNREGTETFRLSMYLE
jgi:Tfp pilus assembly protein PilN